MATTVTWTQDGNGNYEVSSANHLKQLMNRGTLYTDAGSAPTAYWEDGTNYIQTADIDLLGDSTDIAPIGDYTRNYVFFGDYDGGEFKISNWSYVDPEFTTTGVLQASVGLFGYTFGTIKNIRMTGLCTLEGYATSAGFLIGTSTGSTILNIECDFSTGSYIDNRAGSVGDELGGIIGLTGSATEIAGITLRGSIDFRTNTHGDERVGGLVGYLNSPTSSQLFQNLATFPSGINGVYAGGIAGRCSLNRYPEKLEKCLNAMTGDINGDQYAGGIAAAITLSSADADKLVNSMTGNITFTGTYSTYVSAGGIFGYAQSDDHITNIYNYMTGDISRINNYGGIGGLIGYYRNSSTSVSLENSINAMNGTVSNAIIGVQHFDFLLTTNIQVNTDFGLVFTTDTYETGVRVVDSVHAVFIGILSLTEIPDLPYFLFQGTDSTGNSYDFDFVFGNLSGNNSFSDTHLLVRNGEVVFQDGSVFIHSLLSLNERSVNIPIVITEVPGAIGYNITYEGPLGVQITAFSDVTTLEHNITGLDPDTEYIIRLFADTGSGYESVEESTTTTLANVAANYDISDFQDSNGVTNLSSLPESTISSINEVIGDLLNTGDIVNVNVKGSLDTTFIGLGDALSISDLNGVLLPFNEASTPGQSVTITLSDSSNVDVDFDEAVNSIIVNGIEYFVGDSFILDGKKVTVVEL